LGATKRQEILYNPAVKKNTVRVYVPLLEFNLLGGGIALSSHGTKTATRLAANASPEPFSNIILSFVGDAFTLGGTLLRAVHPAVLIGIVLVAVLISVFFSRWVFRSLKKLFERSAAPSLG